jgi:hypothetical protein
MDFSFVYQEYQPKIIRYLTHFSGETEAADLTQTIFLKVSQSLDGFRGEELILRALKESKQIQFPIEAVCTIKKGDSDYYSCEKSNQQIGFSRYRIYFYNTLNKTAEVNAYLYFKK